MPLSTDLEILNRILRDLSGSFLQYVGEIWPWSSVGVDGEKLRRLVSSSCARQQQSIALVAQYLAVHQPRVEYGAYSADFTDLHYVSLQFLLKQLIAQQTILVESLSRLVTLLPNGDESQVLVAAVRQNEQQNLSDLQQAST